MDWSPGIPLTTGAIIVYESTVYRCLRNHMTSDKNLPNENPLGVYRPVNRINTETGVTYAGNRIDPIPFLYGMDVLRDIFYSYANQTWMAQDDFIPCFSHPAHNASWSMIYSLPPESPRGTAEDPIPLADNIRVYCGYNYLYNGTIYRAKHNFIPPTITPDVRRIWTIPVNPWAPDIILYIHERIKYNGVMYQILETHKTSESLLPGAADSENLYKPLIQ